MVKLTDLNVLKSILSRQELSPNRRLGQNFLVSERVVQRMAGAADLEGSEVVVEIGAGLGTVTVELARRVDEVIAVEKDPRLAAFLQKNLLQEGLMQRVRVVEGDILNLEVASGQLSLAGSVYPLPTAGYKVVGAIPYQITSPLLHRLVQWDEVPRRSVLTMQREVAEKISAQPPQANYLSVFLEPWLQVELVGGVISPDSFYPPPKVESRVVRLVVREQPLLDWQEVSAWESFIHRGFAYPRKMLRNVLPVELLKRAGVDPRWRASKLSWSEWRSLFRATRL